MVNIEPLCPEVAGLFLLCQISSDFYETPDCKISEIFHEKYKRETDQVHNYDNVAVEKYLKLK